MKKFFCMVISLIMIMTFSSCGSEGASSTAYYKDDTVPGALNTYLNALMNDDYETYLKITHSEDNEKSKRDFNSKKAGYTSVDSVSYTEVQTNTLFSTGNEYMVAVYDSDGTQKENYSYVNGEKYAYGLVVVAKDYSSDTYYVSSHMREFNFNY